MRDGPVNSISGYPEAFCHLGNHEATIAILTAARPSLLEEPRELADTAAVL